MELRRLEIYGFKSFANKLRLDFNPGITAIVGPNGCGKTNISEAIRWVMGEQNARLLRGEKMEDTIFNGTKDKKPLSMAEVSLIFSNNRNILPVDYDEVAVTRKIFRSGESNYFINRTPCRLKDISDLFLDTGMGADSYSLIEQRMVDSLLDEKDNELRHLIEEAAGITRYKNRRKAAERKLEGTEQDLLRVEDIVAEVERNVSSLYRQMKKAERYQRYKGEEGKIEITLALSEIDEINNLTEPIAAELDLLRKKKEGEFSQLSVGEAEVEELKLKVIEFENILKEQQKQMDELNKLIQQAEEGLIIARERMKGSRGQITRKEVEIQELEERRIRLQTEKEELTEELAAIESRLRHVGEMLEKEGSQLNLFEEDLRKQIEAQGRVQKQRLDSLKKMTELRTEMSSLTAGVESLKQRQEEIQESISQTVRRSEELDQLSGRLRENIIQLTDRFEQSENRLTELDRLAEETASEKEASLGRRQKESARVEALSSKLDLLEKLAREYEGMPSGVKAIVAESEKVDGAEGIVADIIKVDMEYEELIECALGEAMQYVITTDIPSTIKAIEFLKSTNKGRATFLPLDQLNSLNLQKAELPDSELILARGTDVVSCDSAFTPVVEFLFHNVLIVRDIEDARKLMATNSASCKFLTLEGEVLFPNGKIRGGIIRRGEEAVWGRRREVDSLRAEIAELNDSLKVVEQSEAKAATKLSEIAQERNKVVDEEQQLQRSVVEAKEKVRSAEQGMAELQNKIADLTSRLQTVRSDIEIKERDLRLLIQLIESEEKASEKIESESEELSEKVKEQETEKSKHNTKSSRLQVGKATLNVRIKELSKEKERLDYELEIVEAKLRNSKEEIEFESENIEKYEATINENSGTLEAKFSERSRLEDSRNELEPELLALREKIRKQESDLRTVRKDREEVQDRVHELELKLSDHSHNKETYRIRMSEEYGIDISNLPDDFQLLEGSLEEIKKMHEEIKKKIKLLGPVNLEALQEYKVEKERFDFLTNQRDDLYEAKDSLNKTITQINRRARELFLVRFAGVKENFVKTFQILFEGGDADLILEDEKDPLECNISILARPRGKRKQQINLLSGGERALTTISILFAIYLEKPSPFCILDEVDAPLDDANITRFIKMLREFSKSTQFIVITHNKRTMEAADFLYGVTMETPGTSQIVSVRLEGKHDLDGEKVVGF